MDGSEFKDMTIEEIEDWVATSTGTTDLGMVLDLIFDGNTALTGLFHMRSGLGDLRAFADTPCGCGKPDCLDAPQHHHMLAPMRAALADIDEEPLIRAIAESIYASVNCECEACRMRKRSEAAPWN